MFNHITDVPLQTLFPSPNMHKHKNNIPDTTLERKTELTLGNGMYVVLFSKRLTPLAYLE